MISVKTDNSTMEVRFSGDAKEIQTEAVLTFIKAATVVGEDKGYGTEIELGSMILTTIDVAREIGIQFDGKRLAKILLEKEKMREEEETKTKSSASKEFECLQRILRKMRDEADGQ